MIKVRGTYQGVPGEYRCTPGNNAAACRVSVNVGGYSLGSGWEFIHDPDAKVLRYAGDYLFFGWWLREDSDGKPLVVSAFFGHGGADTGYDASAGSNVTGKGTYVGPAVGKYAISNTPDGMSEGATSRRRSHCRPFSETIMCPRRA